MLTYTAYKTIVCVAGMDSSLSSIYIENMYDVKEHDFDLNDYGFKIAF